MAKTNEPTGILICLREEKDILHPLKKLHNHCQNHPFSPRYDDHKNIFSHNLTSGFSCFPCFSPDPVILLKRLNVFDFCGNMTAPIILLSKRAEQGVSILMSEDGLK